MTKPPPSDIPPSIQREASRRPSFRDARTAFATNHELVSSCIVLSRPSLWRAGRGAQTAIRYTKIATNLALKQLLTSVFEAGVAFEGLSRHTDDYREGVTSFVEKRRPRFTGL